MSQFLTTYFNPQIRNRRKKIGQACLVLICTLCVVDFETPAGSGFFSLTTSSEKNPQ
jgi:hypothetical protein